MQINVVFLHIYASSEKMMKTINNTKELDYREEKNMTKMPPIHPGEILKDELEKLKTK